MTKRHFEAFARIISQDVESPEYDSALCLYAALVFAQVATEFNPRFDREHFFKACGLSHL